MGDIWDFIEWWEKYQNLNLNSMNGETENPEQTGDKNIESKEEKVSQAQGELRQYPMTPDECFKIEPNQFTTYNIEGTYGVSDLKSIYPYEGEWSVFSAHYGVTEQEYLANPKAYEKRVREDNETYLEELRLNGKLGTKYTSSISLMHNPMFDDPQLKLPEKPNPDSYSFKLLDFSTVPKMPDNPREFEKDFQKEIKKAVFDDKYIIGHDPYKGNNSENKGTITIYQKSGEGILEQIKKSHMEYLPTPSVLTPEKIEAFMNDIFNFNKGKDKDGTVGDQPKR